jgi:parallel beta-helix repeat protein
MTMEVEDSHIVGNFFPDAQGDTGIDMLASESTVVTNNNVTGSAGDGIDCSGTTDCRVGNNDVSGFAGGSLGLVKIGATTLRAWDNIGDVLGIGSTFVDLDVHTAAGGADEVVFTLTIPGNTLTKKGDSIHVRIFGDCDGTSTLGSGDIKFAGTSLMTIVLRGPFNESEYAVDVWIVLDADDGNIDATALSMNRDDLSYAPQGSAVTVDMGVDQNITVNLHGGDTNSASLLKFFLEVSKGTD